MNEQKGAGRGIFYGVIGVATLVVAIIGATFAYFTASAQTGAGNQNITGRTNDELGTALTITTTRVHFSGVSASAGDDLVPGGFNNATPGLDASDITAALQKGCVDGGYTGCHVWKVQATSTQNIDHANIELTLTLNNVATKTQWGYAVYTTADDTETGTPTLATVANDRSASNAIDENFATPLDIHNNAALTTAGKIYYVMVYLNNVTSAQNNTTEGTNDTGSYTGTVTMSAAGGKVSATFVSG